MTCLFSRYCWIVFCLRVSRWARTMGGSGNIELHRLMRNRDNGIKQAKCLLKNAFGDGSPKAFLTSIWRPCFWQRLTLLTSYRNSETAVALVALWASRLIVFCDFASSLLNQTYSRAGEITCMTAITSLSTARGHPWWEDVASAQCAELPPEFTAYHSN